MLHLRSCERIFHPRTQNTNEADSLIKYFNFDEIAQHSFAYYWVSILSTVRLFYCQNIFINKCQSSIRFQNHIISEKWKCCDNKMFIADVWKFKSTHTFCFSNLISKSPQCCQRGWRPSCFFSSHWGTSWRCRGSTSSSRPRGPVRMMVKVRFKMRTIDNYLDKDYSMK